MDDPKGLDDSVGTEKAPTEVCQPCFGVRSASDFFNSSPASKFSYTWSLNQAHASKIEDFTNKYHQNRSGKKMTEGLVN